jgi:uncharacterized membrane protein YgdD (TMEM256/DUF423 family)
VDRAFLVSGAVLAFLGVAAGAFGSHALRTRLGAERLGTVETAVRYQLWHALALFVVVFLRTIGPDEFAESLAGVLFLAGIVLFSGSLYLVAVTGSRRWGVVAPVGGVCMLAGWASLAVCALSTPFHFSP